MQCMLMCLYGVEMCECVTVCSDVDFCIRTLNGQRPAPAPIAAQVTPITNPANVVKAVGSSIR